VTTETETTTNAADTRDDGCRRHIHNRNQRSNARRRLSRGGARQARHAGQHAARQETTTQQETQKVEPSSIPSAYDEENFKAFLARQALGRLNWKRP
jgi:hypothetical protein